MSYVVKLTSKYQTTIPLEVRKTLHLEKGDAIAFDVKGKEVKIRRALPIDFAYARAVESTLTEWNSKADDDAYRDL